MKQREKVLLILFWFFILAFISAPGYGAPVLVNFEDDQQAGSNITCNPDLGLPYECNPSHYEWLMSKGIDITGTPNGFVWSTRIFGSIGATGVVIGFASPSFGETDSGLSDNEVLTVHFLDSPVNLVGIELTVIPSYEPIINNIPATVFMNAFDSGGNLIASEARTFTGVTDGVYTPIVMSISTVGIAKITLETTSHPYGGVWIESIIFDKQVATIDVPVDIKPQSCPNPLNVNSGGVLPAAILGTVNLDVATIDPASIRLQGVAPVRSAFEDVATPLVPFVGKESAFDCTATGPDGLMDLTLKFDHQAVMAALGAVTDGEVLVLKLTGNLLQEFGGIPIEGEDVVSILKKRKK